MAVMMPLAVVLVSAPAKVAQGKTKVQALESLPLPETQLCALVADIEAVQKNTAADVSKTLRIFMGLSFLEL
jgi:hypothetical protein